MQNLRLVVPVFNDWTSCNYLLQDLDRVARELPVRISVSLVNDGSMEMPVLDDVSTLHNLESVEIIHLAVNLGHQRAIAVGLCVAVEDDDFDAVLIMDADGEDSPQVIGRLLAATEGKRDFCIVARRRKRSENMTFRFSYLIYKFVFKMLTGAHINFGNFSVLSQGYAQRLVRVPDLWNNLPAAVLRSRLPIQFIPTDRAKRYAGKSKMNFTSLVVHGLSGISVYADTIFVRMLLLTMGMAAVTGPSVAFVLVLRLFFPAHATPGWATTVSFGMIIILVEIFSVTLSSILMLLNSRVQRLIMPITDYRGYVEWRQPVLNAEIRRAAGDVHTLSEKLG
jgi:glycosyltransferase involved in cell wall biosynthesis